MALESEFFLNSIRIIWITWPRILNFYRKNKKIQLQPNPKDLSQEKVNNKDLGFCSGGKAGVGV